MPTEADCPGTGIYDWGYGPRVQAWRPTEAAAFAAMQAQLPVALAGALVQQQAALNAAMAVGAGACNPGQPPCQQCEAWFRAPAPGAPWTAVGAIDPFNNWLARGGYKWTVEVDCRCPPVAAQPDCTIIVVAGGIELDKGLDALRLFRDERLPQSRAGRRYAKLYAKHNDELIAMLFENSELFETSQGLLPKVIEHVPKTKTSKGKRIGKKLVEEIDQALVQVSEKASTGLRRDIKRLRSELACFAGVSIVDGLERVG